MEKTKGEIGSEVAVPIDHNYHQSSNQRIKRWEASLSNEYLDYRRKWTEYPRIKKLTTFPIHLDIEATTACNLRCIMCPRTELVKNGKMWKIQNFNINTYKTVIDQGVEKGLCSIKLNFLGEPMLNRKLIDMITYAKEVGVIDVMFNTNATLLDENYSRQLIHSGLDKIFFSFDSPYRAHYNNIRVGADFDKVLYNIKRFVEIRNRMDYVTPFTRASMVLRKDNENEWKAFQELFSPIVDAVAYVDYGDQGGLKKPEWTIVRTGEPKKTFCCAQLWQRMFIHPDGVVTVCCIDGLRELQVGNIFDNSAAEIWNSHKYNELRKMHAEGRFEEIPLCASCAMTKL